MKTDFFEIVAGVLLGCTLAPYLFIICLDNMPRTSIDLMKENGFTLEKTRSRRYPAQTITDVDYTDDIALLANTPAQAKSLLLSLEQAVGGIGLHVNADKTKFMCFNQRGNIFTLKCGSQKLVDKDTYLGSSVSFTKKYHQYYYMDAVWAYGEKLDSCSTRMLRAVLKKIPQNSSYTNTYHPSRKPPKLDE